MFESNLDTQSSTSQSLGDVGPSLPSQSQSLVELSSGSTELDPPRGGKNPATAAKYTEDAIKNLPRVETSNLDVVIWGEGKSRKRWQRPAAWVARRNARKKVRRGYARRAMETAAGEYVSRKEFISRLKAAPCQDCKGTFHPVAMDFDHVRGEKKFMLSKARKESKKAILEELAKCDLVCSNCHRVRTFNRTRAAALPNV